MPTEPQEPLAPAVAKLIQNITALREKRNWSRDRLCEEARIDKSTMYRIEKGKQRPNPRTVASVAAALGVTADELWGGETMTGDGLDPGRQGFSKRMRIRNQTMNALAMTALRYKVSAAAILEAAPLLFTLAAEASLKRRQEKLSEVLGKIDEVSGAHVGFPHVPSTGFFHWFEALDVESASIAKRDLFARELDNAEIHSHGDAPYDSDSDNPLVRYLKDWADELDAGIEITSWPFWMGPDYVVGREEAADYVGGDEEAAQAIILGTAPVNLLQRDLGVNATPEARAEWAIARAREHKAKVDAWEADVLALAAAIDDAVNEEEQPK